MSKDILSMTMTDFLYEKRSELYKYIEEVGEIEVTNRSVDKEPIYIISKQKYNKLHKMEELLNE